MADVQHTAPKMARAAEVRASSFDETDNTIELVFTTGAKVRRYSWSEGAYDEELVVDGGSVRLGRLNAGAPFLNTHADYRLEHVIGSVVPGSARIEGGKGHAKVVLSKREEVRGLVQDIRDGVIRNVSVGYRYHKVEKTDGQDGDPALWRVVDWEPLEISAVPIPADPGAQMRSADADAGEPKHGFTMIAAEPDSSADAAAIRDLGRKVDMTDLADRSIRAGLTVPEFRVELFRAIQEKEDAVPTHTAMPVDDRVHVTGPSGGERRGQAVANALLHRAEPSLFALSDDAREFRGMSLLEIARDSLEAAGISTRGMSRIDIAARALAGATRSGGLHSTSDFPAILSNVANKTLRAGYEAAPQTFRPLVRMTTAPDFKQISRVQLGEAPQLEKVNEYGEFKRGTIGEGKESFALLTYGKIVGVTRQAIVNDEMGAFTRIPRMFGVQAANLESDLVWAQIVGNPTMGDGVALFHANHGNLGTAAGISADSVALGFEAMRLQKGLDGKTLLNLAPRYLVTSVAAVMKAEQLLGSIRPVETGKVVPNYLTRLEHISEPRLDNGFTDPATGAAIAGSRFHWFLAAGPDQIDTVELVHLEGREGAFTETRQGFDIDGMEIKVRLDAAAKTIDWRAFYKNPAAAL